MTSPFCANYYCVYVAAVGGCSSCSQQHSCISCRISVGQRQTAALSSCTLVTCRHATRPATRYRLIKSTTVLRRNSAQNNAVVYDKRRLVLSSAPTCLSIRYCLQFAAVCARMTHSATVVKQSSAKKYTRYDDMTQRCAVAHLFEEQNHLFEWFVFFLCSIFCIISAYDIYVVQMYFVFTFVFIHIFYIVVFLCVFFLFFCPLISSVCTDMCIIWATR